MNTIKTYELKKMSPQLLVSDLNRSFEFYSKILGFELDFRYEYFYVGIIKDGYSIHLKLSYPSTDERKNKYQNEHLDLTFSVDNIETLYEELLDKAVEFIQPLRKMPYGKEFYIVDPDGHVIAFLE